MGLRFHSWNLRTCSMSLPQYRSTSHCVLPLQESARRIVNVMINHTEHRKLDDSMIFTKRRITFTPRSGRWFFLGI